MLSLKTGIFHVQYIVRKGEPIIIEICRSAPTVEVLAHDARGILKYLSENTFDFEDQFIVENEIPADLVKISSSKIFFEKATKTEARMILYAFL